MVRLDRGRRGGVDDVCAVDRQHALGGALVSPGLLVPGHDEDCVPVARVRWGVESGVRFRREQADQVIVVLEGLEVEVVSTGAARDGELVVRPTLELERPPSPRCRPAFLRRQPPGDALAVGSIVSQGGLEDRPLTGDTIAERSRVRLKRRVTSSRASERPPGAEACRGRIFIQG